MNLFTRFSLCLCLILGSLMTRATPDASWDIQCITISSITVVSDTCGLAEGSITVEHDGTAPFSYAWSHDSLLTDSVAGQLTSGSYALTVSDDAGCSTDTLILVGNFNPLQLLGATTPDTCGASNGTASVDVVLNGFETAPFTFQWDTLTGSQTTQVALGLSGGTYVVVATDAQGCEASIELNVGSVDNSFDGVMVVEDARCHGDSTGTVSVIPTGGNNRYTYAWTASGDTVILGTDSILADVPPGPYELVMTDPTGDGCMITRLATIGEADSLEAQFIANGASDCKDADGEAYAVPVGGTPPYQYLWSTGETNDTVLNLLPGFYSLTVTDTNGCSDTKVIPLTSDTGPKFDVQILQEDNCGLGEGIARINIELGTAPFTTEWWVTTSRPRDSATSTLYHYDLFRNEGINDLYTVVVVDADSCLDVQSFRMPGNPPLAVENIESKTNYCELADGTTTVDISGGTLPYTYEWTTSPPQTTATAVGLTAGSYSVTVRDSFNCVITDTVEVADEPGFTLEVETTDVSCYGADDGTAKAKIANGRWPYRYQWEDPVSAENTIINLSGGVYNLTVTDADGCVRSAFGEVEAVTYIHADFATTPPPGDTLATVLSSAGFIFTNLSEGADEYLWDFGDGRTSTEVEPVHVYQDTGHFYVELKAINNGGDCIDSMTLGPFIVAIDGILHVPDAFSPNGDGFNDFFDVKGDLVQTYNLQVFSRWGQEIFQSNSIDLSWDGRMPNGKAAPQGVYVYRLQATAVGEKGYDETGTITLLR